MSLTLRPLRTYEPDEGFEPPERWSTLQPAPDAQVTIEAPDEPDDEPFRRMLTTVLEVLDGRRPIGQLRTLLAPAVYEATLTRLRTMPAGIQYRLRSVHSYRVHADAIELCGRVEAMLRAGRRARALVARLERRDGTWHCVVLRIL
jgi:hypothetical protein